jgi:hypothetical protein
VSLFLVPLGRPNPLFGICLTGLGVSTSISSFILQMLPSYAEIATHHDNV